MDIGLAIAVFAAVIVILILRTIIHIVPQYQRLVVLALGRYQKMAGPGLVLLLPPPIQVGINVDLREFVVEIPQQTCITKDNAPISIDFLIYQKVVEPKDSFLNIQNFRQAIQGIATTTLRAVVGNIGSPEHLDYSAIGSTVNLAARLCGQAEALSIVVSKAVRDAVANDERLYFHSERSVSIRGVREPVTVYALSRPT